MKKIGLVVVACLLAAILGTIGGIAYLRASHAPPAAPPPPPLGAQIPNAAFLSQYDDFLALSADVAKRQDKLIHSSAYEAMQDEQDRANGMAQRLTAQVPQGYTFDQKYRAFVPRTPAPQPEPPAPPKK